MAASNMGSIEQYDGKDDWVEYAERFKQYLIANKITEADRKRAVFLASIGRNAYRILRNLVTPAKPESVSFDDLLEAMQKHYRPAPSEIVERCKFHSRYRRPGESVATFVAELRNLSEFCNFGEKLEEMIRDRLVCGINDGAMQKRLLAETGLTYTRAVELAQALERADRNMREIKPKDRGESSGHTGPLPVNRMGDEKLCYRCGKPGHFATKCRISKDVVCRKCKKEGHIQQACRIQPKPKPVPSKGKSLSSQRGKYRPVNQVGDEETDEDEDLRYMFLVRSKHAKAPPITADLNIDGCLISMEVDTGASTSVMSETQFRELWPGRSLESTKVRLKSYTLDEIPVVGACVVEVSHESMPSKQLRLIVVAGSGPCLMGRDWLQFIRLDWNKVHHMWESDALQEVIDKHADVFKPGLGTLKGYKAKIHLNPGAVPKYYRARSVPYSRRQAIEKELQRLMKEGNIEPVQVSDWAAPIVPVLKKDNDIRICGDFRLTVNASSKLDNYPIPKINDLFAKLKGGKVFTKIDLSQAYQQVMLDDESKQYLVINTHKGLFRFTRLPFGVSSAPGIFQRIMEGILQDIEGVVVAYLDDILIAAETEEEHLKILNEVLSRLEKAGLRVKLRKCEFLKSSVEYLGHRIDASGLHPLQDKVKAIQKAPVPTSVTELKAYLGLLSYYGKFLPNLSSTLHPLYQLLRKDQPWHWGSSQQQAFAKSKKLLTSDTCLTHFDPTLKLKLACDASSYGLGAVLAHEMPDGTERPIGYVSRTLSKAERNYSQLEKEGLACIFGIKKFHDYLFGHPFELITDHKPLLGLLKGDRVLAPQASARIKRWSLFLGAYEYTLVFRKTEAHANADALSRLPLPGKPTTPSEPPELVLLTEHLEESPVTADDISVWTRRDPKLSRILQYVQKGWPSECSDQELKAYYSKRLEMSSHQSCLLWGCRVVVPEPGQEGVLRELHEGHPGITRMKSLARMYVWWPGIDRDIEKSVRQCQECQAVQSSPPPAPLHPWKWPTRPWARLHLDFAGPFCGKTFLVMIDAHSKWIEAVCTPSTSSQAVIEELRTVFAKFGLPETIVTDNGSGFTSREFRQFLQQNGIHHTTSAPYHPSSNGLAERAVQVVKKGLKKIQDGTIRTRLAKVLLAYRTTPQVTTGRTPAELLLGRLPRTRLDLLKPDTAQRVEHKQEAQKATHDARARIRTFEVGDAVFAKNHGDGNKWLAGVITKRTGPVSFHIQLSDGRERRCHQDQIRSRAVQADRETDEEAESETSAQDSEVEWEWPPLVPEAAPVAPPTSAVPPPPVPTAEEGDQPRPRHVQCSGSETPVTPASAAPVRKTYPQRTRTARQWYEPGTN